MFEQYFWKYKNMIFQLNDTVTVRLENEEGQ